MTPLIELIDYAKRHGASDIHLSLGRRPALRVAAALVESELDAVTREAMDGYMEELIPAARRERFLRTRELDFSCDAGDLARLRVSAYVQRASVAFSIRLLPEAAPPLDAVGLPALATHHLVEARSGLILVTGPTGAGKTTTLAAIVEAIATTRACHVLTIEDPIEYVYRRAKATIHQREVGVDTLSFAHALRHVLRQDPDVIVIGEMRDMETVGAALTAAETGHLVLATLHTPDAVQTINRIIDVFPEPRQAQARTQLSFALNAVIAQRLVPRGPQPGRALAAETLVVNQAVRNLVRELKVHQIYSAIQTGSAEGMRTMSQSLADLVRRHCIPEHEAIRVAPSAEELRRALDQPTPPPWLEPARGITPTRRSDSDRGRSSGARRECGRRRADRCPP